MNITESQMRNLTDDELLRFIESEDDTLTTTDLERELTRRLAEAQDELAELQVVRTTMENNNLDQNDIKELLEILSEFCVENPGSLRDKLERADEFYDIAQEAGDTLERLSNLAKTTL